MRKARYKDNRLYHLRKGLVRARLSDELCKKLGKKAKTVRKGDTVRIMTGSSQGKEGKVLEVDYKDAVIYIEGLVSRTSRGTEKPRPFNSSNVLLIAIGEGYPKKEKAEKTAAKTAIPASTDAGLPTPTGGLSDSRRNQSRKSAIQPAPKAEEKAATATQAIA